MWTLEADLLICFTFVLAGMTKGVVGLGLPTVSLALLTVFFGLQDAIVLMLVPSFVTNLWQALDGPHGRDVLRRFWPLMGAGFLATCATAGLITELNTALLTTLLGGSIALYAALGLSPVTIPNPRQHESWMSPVAGGLTGALTGLTGSMVVPSVPYFQSLGLPREYLLQAMGAWFTIAMLALGVSFGWQSLLPLDQGVVSVAALAPAAFGMWLGRKIRRRLSENLFRRLFFLSLLVLGLYITVVALV